MPCFVRQRHLSRSRRGIGCHRARDWLLPLLRWSLEHVAVRRDMHGDRMMHRRYLYCWWPVGTRSVSARRFLMMCAVDASVACFWWMVGWMGMRVCACGDRPIISLARTFFSPPFLPFSVSPSLSIRRRSPSDDLRHFSLPPFPPAPLYLPSVPFPFATRHSLETVAPVSVVWPALRLRRPCLHHCHHAHRVPLSHSVYVSAVGVSLFRPFVIRGPRCVSICRFPPCSSSLPVLMIAVFVDRLLTLPRLRGLPSRLQFTRIYISAPVHSRIHKSYTPLSVLRATLPSETKHMPPRERGPVT
ncbi:hypothetical protein FKP32DRAFT_240542 [Trametes sanguinea]|nr:hypothetical protein FKP32DRAFT_240542 [Trametes sanguinea]